MFTCKFQSTILQAIYNRENVIHVNPKKRNKRYNGLVK